MSKYLTYKEDKTTPNIYTNDQSISWTNAISTTPYTITTTPNLSGTIVLDNTADSAICTSKLASTITDSIETSIKSKEQKAYAAAKLDNNSDEGGYSCLTAYVPRKTE